MPDQTKTLEILNREKEYEDALVEKLTNYFLVSIEGITDMTAEQKRITTENLKRINFDSIKHSQVFNHLIQFVVENGENNY